MTEVMIRVEDLYKVYHVGRSRVFALNGVSFEITRGDFVAIVGTSGSGKSTLLNLMAGLEPPTKGQIKINGRSIVGRRENELVRFRREHVGFVFQSFNLISSMTALENVALPLTFRGISRRNRTKLARRLLETAGLSTHLQHKPTELSAGQQQRVGIARALVVGPDIIYADEPTGNLDSRTSAEIMDLIQSISREKQQTVVMVTHDEQLAQYADRIFRIMDGKIIAIEQGSKRHESPREAGQGA